MESPHPGRIALLEAAGRVCVDHQLLWNLHWASDCPSLSHGQLTCNVDSVVSIAHQLGWIKTPRGPHQPTSR